MFEFLAGVVNSAVTALFGERVKRGIERAATPPEVEQREKRETDYLREIRDLLASDDPASRRGEGQNTQLTAAVQLLKPPYFQTIWKSGRRKMRVLTAADVTLVIQGGSGQYETTVTAGQWRELDLPDGSAIALDPDDPADSRTITVQYDGR